jgi:hypothetical protein
LRKPLTHARIAVALALGVCASIGAQHTGLTDAQIKSAEIEIPRPVELLELKPGGRLAVIDFPPRPDTDVPPGVPANRGGHGVPPDVVEREVRAALTHVRTISPWSPASQPASLYLVLFRKP